jgi:glycosyltransferase involved in cell wall biosynthesis
MISVVIPTYNRAKYLKKALDSLIKQGVVDNNFEVVVIDDGSRDGTKKISEQYIKKLNLKYIHSDHGGVSLARNRGIKESSGDVIVFFDDDAIASVDWIESIEKIMKKESVITGSVEPIKNNIWQYFAPHYDQGDKPIKSSVLLEGNCAIKRKVFDDVGRFDEKLTYGHEGEEFISRASKKYKIMYYPNVIIHHDYAFGIFNYLNKQFKFGHKMSYLKYDEIKGLFDLIFNYKKIKKGKAETIKIKKTISLWNKIRIYKIAKLGSVAHFVGAIIGYLKYRK